MSDKFLVILIDTNAEYLLEAQSLFSESNLEVKPFTDASDGLKAIEEDPNRVALILSDIQLGSMTAFDLKEYLNEKDRDIPYVLYSDSISDSDIGKCSELRIVRNVAKPLTKDFIEEIISGEVSERIESINEDREMVSEFLQETKPMLEEIEELILSLEEDPNDKDAVNTYFRLLHTIKGTSSCLGLSEIAGYSHNYEDLITKVKENKIQVNRMVIDVLLVGLDQLKELYGLAESFKPFPPDLEEKAKVFHQDFDGTSDIEIPVTERPASNNAPAANLQNEGEAKDKVKKEKEEKVTVPESLLSHFLEMSGELTVIRNSIFKTLTKVQEKLPGDSDIEHLGESMLEMQKVSAILQNQISEMKKVSIDTVYRPMRRVVRDSCSVLNKDVDFQILGDNLNIDTSVAKLLNGALVHLLRNGVDHGIENEADRIAAGKPAQGKLTLNSYETGEDIIVEIQDDGKGLNKDVLKNKAIEKGIYTEKELSTMSDQKIFSIIFESGFSTNTVVTSVSGRGVGMDMVKSSIEEFGGKILIDSELGKGSKFILIIPIPRSILIIKSLIVTANESKFNIPLDDVHEVVLFNSNKKEQQIYNSNGSLVLKHHNVLCPLIDLGATLGIRDNFNRDNFDNQNIVIVKGEGFRYGILVDEIEDIEEIVLKKLSNHFKIEEYLGTTFADDGALSMILDCKGIANRYGIENEQEEDHSQFLKSEVNETSKNEFMRFSLSSAPNCALPLGQVYRLEEMKSRDIQFTGNRALIRYRGQSLPLLHLEHLLEMTDVTLEDLMKQDLTLSVLVVKSEEGKLYGAIIDELLDIATSESDIDSSFSDRAGFKGTVTIEDRIITVVDIEELIGQQYSGTLRFNNLEKKNYAA